MLEYYKKTLFTQKNFLLPFTPLSQRPQNTSKLLFLVVSRQKILFLVSFFIDMLIIYKITTFYEKMIFTTSPPLSRSPPEHLKITDFQCLSPFGLFVWSHLLDLARKSRFQWQFFSISPLSLPIMVNIVFFRQNMSTKEDAVINIYMCTAHITRGVA